MFVVVTEHWLIFSSAASQQLNTLLGGKGPMLTSTQIASFTGISDRTIRDWQTKNIIPKTADMSVVMKAIVSYYKDKIEKERQSSNEDELYREKCRLTQAQADKMKLEVAEKEGELISSNSVVMAWSSYIQACRSRLLSMPTKLSPRLAEISDSEKIKEMIEEIVDEALNELGSGDFVRSVESASKYSDSISSASSVDS
jgi:phage terminase Nu1 subunit (DNA packaging protein)